CAGLLHDESHGPEKTIRAVDADFMMENIRVNTLPTLMLARHFSPVLKRSLSPLFATVSAKVGSIADNRLGGWYSYRLSKAALNMAIKTLSIEWRHANPRGVVAALHPGTNDTALSQPFQKNVPPSNLMLPEESCEAMVDVLQGLTPANSGKFWAWDGEELPW
ncbi:MAG: short chain dehydrogenase, partial [Pseudomonadota bacterium]